MMFFRHFACPALIVCLTGCASTEMTAPAALANTAWQLTVIQSMDDAQGNTRVPAGEIYAVRFASDGSASFQLYCNRGSGRWQAQAGARDGGSLSFGPIATTRMMCAQPSMDQRVTASLSYVRSYLLRDGKLYLSLMADGGILEWEALKP